MRIRGSGFAVVRRRWTSGDALTFEFPLHFAPKPSTICILKPWRCCAGRWFMSNRIRPSGEAAHANPEALRPRPERREFFHSHTGSRTRTYAPFYLVRDEAYTMYAQLG